MSRWIQVVAVALAAVVGLVPAFAQVGYSQAVSVQETLIVLPVADEIPDTELALIVGQMWDDNRWGSGGGGGGGDVLLWLGAKALEKLAHAVTQAVTFVGRGIAYVAIKTVVQHPLATDLIFNATLGGLAGGLLSKEETLAGKLTDAAKGAVVGLGIGLTTAGYKYVVPRLAAHSAPRVTYTYTTVDLENLDEWTTWTIRRGR